MRKHLLTVGYISLLALIFIAAAWAFSALDKQPLYQLYVVVAAVSSYVVLGVVHSHLRKRLTSSVLVEYLLVGALAFLLFTWTLFS
jgi:NADH:ubiquinone oxidoreductase subunit K